MLLIPLPAVASSRLASDAEPVNGGFGQRQGAHLPGRAPSPRGGHVRVSGWVKTRNVVVGERRWQEAALQLIRYDAERKSVGHVDVVLLAGTHAWGVYPRTFRLSRQVAFFAIPCHLGGERTRGPAWFDDHDSQTRLPRLRTAGPV